MAEWQRVEIDGKAADLFLPQGQPRHVLIFLHSLGQETLADPVAERYTTLLEHSKLACVCPHGGESWWTDRIDPHYDSTITAESHLLNKLVPWMRERWPAHRPIGLFGVSMGGQGALRLAFKQPELFPVVAAVSPAIEYHQIYGHGTALDEMYTSKEQCRQDTVPMHLHPSRQPPHVFFACDPDDATWFRGSDRLHEKMLALGSPHQCELESRHGGHSWAYFNSQAKRIFTFLVNGMVEESRRLI